MYVCCVFHLFRMFTATHVVKIMALLRNKLCASVRLKPGCLKLGRHFSFDIYLARQVSYLRNHSVTPSLSPGKPAIEWYVW